MRLLVIVDSHEYARSNCYIHQLLTTLERNAETTVLTLYDVRRFGHWHDITKFDRILLCLKLRTTVREIELVSKFLGNTPVYYYEQDVWECFSDQATYPGSYQMIASAINIKSFLNTSKWWSDHVNSKGLPSKFVNMWMLPEYCSADPQWSTRKVDVGFCGQLHPYRRELFELLQREGINVHHFPSGDYQHYLRCLSKMKIFVHSEQVNWSVDGTMLDGPNALWIKDIEAAARGCVSMREYEPECLAYQADDLWTVVPFESPKELVLEIHNTLSEDEQRNIDDRSMGAVKRIANARGWRTVLDAMEIA